MNGENEELMNKFGESVKENLEPNDTGHDIIRCDGCERYFYDVLGNETNPNYLQQVYEDKIPYKGCGNCQTDKHLKDLK